MKTTESFGGDVYELNVQPGVLSSFAARSVLLSFVR